MVVVALFGPCKKSGVARKNKGRSSNQERLSVSDTTFRSKQATIFSFDLRKETDEACSLINALLK